jgi:molybdopterin-containing oxidoreductase family membrane subunit
MVTKHRIIFEELKGNSFGFYALVGILGALVAMGLFAAYTMEHHGHVITGMDNQIVWGLPHIFAIFLILSASGVLNVASIGSVFRKAFYHPLARLSGLLAITLLVGGLVVLVLDLGRPDRLIVAMTSYNFKSIFTWNVFLYNGFIGVVGVYLWVMMDRRLQQFYHPMGLIAFIGRFILTTGTGSIFGFLVARSAYDTAILAPLFISMSLVLGMAVFLLVLIASCVWGNRAMGVAFLERPKSLLSLFLIAVFYLVTVYYLTNLYVTKQQDLVYFILGSGSVYTYLFWIGYLILGTIIPLIILYHPIVGKTRNGIIAAASLVVIGGFSLLYTIIIGGQAIPLDIFPGMEIVSSGFFDDRAYHPYVPSIWEFMLGIGGIGFAMLLTVLGMRVLPFLFVPSSLSAIHLTPEEID